MLELLLLNYTVKLPKIHNGARMLQQPWGIPVPSCKTPKANPLQASRTRLVSPHATVPIKLAADVQYQSYQPAVKRDMLQ